MIQGRRSGGITGRRIKREKENQNGIIRDICYERNYIIEIYGNVSSHKTIPPMKRISKVALVRILPCSLHCESELQ